MLARRRLQYIKTLTTRRCRGREGDIALVATENGHPVGAAWLRAFRADAPGYGFVDEQTPEVTISIVPSRRGHGLGQELLDALLAIERERGRERPYPNAARTLDLDLILFGARTIDEPGLVVPHPRFRERRFVLEPLAGIAPGLVDPVSGLTVGALLEKIA